MLLVTIKGKNMTVKHFFLMLFTFCATAVVIGAQNSTEAVIIYMEGTVDISRDGQYLDYYDVDIGTVIENYDMIETGDDGFLEIEVKTPVSPAVTLKIHENTNFYFDTKKSQGKTKTSFQLLAGSMGLKVQKLMVNNELDVNVNENVMGVRGTEFTISSTIDGSTLVTTKEGRVSCTNKKGKVGYTSPGVVCETEGDSAFKEVPVPVDQLDNYTKKWNEARMEVLRSNALVSIRHYSRLYTQFYPRFDNSWKALERKDSTFDKWYRYMRSGNKPSLSEAVLDKQSVSREIIELRSVLPIYQHTYYVMSVLLKLHDEGYGRGSITGSMNQTQLFNHFKGNMDETRRRLAKSLFYFRIYLEMGKRISGSDINSEGLLDSITGGSNMLMGPPTPNFP